MSKAYVLLPDVQFTTDVKTRQLITESLKKVLPQGNFKAQSIIFAKKENRYNAFIQTTPEVETKLLQTKNINLGGVQIPIRRCFPQYQVYINKLSDSITKQDIQTYFSQFGKIVDVQLLPADHMYDNSKGNVNNKLMNINHCYIRFQQPNDVEKCLFSENKHTIKNIDIRTVRAFKIGENDETDRKLFLKLSPIVQFEASALQFELYNIFKKYGELREKIRIQQISNSSSKSIITFTSIQGGQKALKQFNLDKIQHYSLILRPFNSKQNFMVFLSGVKSDVSIEELKKVLEQYGPVLNCTLLPSKKINLCNAIATYSSQQNFKHVLADFKFNQKFNKFFALKPFITVHMNAKERNQYNDYRKRDKKTEQFPVMPMKMNFPFGGYPQQPTMMGQFGGIGQPMGQQMGQPMGQPIGFNINNLNQQMKIPQSFKQ